MTFGGFGAGANDFGLPYAGLAARAGAFSALSGAAFSAAATTGGFASAASAAALFFVCFAMTSRRCCSRRRASRHSAKARTAWRPAWPAAVRIAPNRRPNENCVDMITASTTTVTMTMSEPVRFRYSESSAASHSPAYPPARKGLPATSSLPNTRLRNALPPPKSRPAPVAFVPAASTVRHQNEFHPMTTKAAGTRYDA